MAHVAELPTVTPVSERGYARPEVLVSTQWVADHLNDSKVRVMESEVKFGEPFRSSFRPFLYRGPGEATP